MVDKFLATTQTKCNKTETKKNSKIQLLHSNGGGGGGGEGGKESTVVGKVTQAQHSEDSGHQAQRPQVIPSAMPVYPPASRVSLVSAPSSLTFSL